MSNDASGIAGWVVTIIIICLTAFVLMPAMEEIGYKKGVKDCMNGKTNVAITNDTTIVMP